MNIDPVKLQRLMKMGGVKSNVSSLTYTQAQSTKKYFESLTFEDQENLTYAIATMVDSREIVFSYSCEFEKAVKYLQDITLTKVKNVNVIREELVEKEDLFIKITEI